MARPEVGIKRCEEIRASLPDDRMVDAHAEIGLGACASYLGLFDEARERLRRGEEIFLDLGQKLWLGGLGMSLGWLEVLAGDLEAAEHAFRRGMEMLRSIGERGFRSTVAVDLAWVLFEQDRFDEAAEMVLVSEGLGASDDLVNQVGGRGIRAKLLAQGGEIESSVAMAEEAVAMTDGIDFWDVLTDAHECLGEVHRLAGRRDDAIASFGRALDVCARKGVVPAIERIRRKLDAVGD